MNDLRIQTRATSANEQPQIRRCKKSPPLAKARAAGKSSLA